MVTSSPADRFDHPLTLVPPRGGSGAASLPRPLTTLVGREREIAVALGLLRRPDVRLLTLTGSGGIGKTRLSIEVARAAAIPSTSPGEGFADGVAFVSLAAVPEAELVATAVVHALGIPENRDIPARDALVLALRDAGMLLVLDNFEHVVAAAPLIPDLLASCPHLKVLVTSRTLLRVTGEHALAVPPLSLSRESRVVSREKENRSTPDSRLTTLDSDAVRLFVERSQAVNPSFALTDETAPLAAEVCRHLDGLPLAIELAAARSSHLPLPALRERLERRLPLLTGGPRDAPPRLQTMRDTIAWSHDLLTGDEQALFRRLAVFRDGFTLEAAEAISRETRDVRRENETTHDSRLTTHVSVIEGVAGLIQASLLHSEPRLDGTTRYRMWETIREFASELLATDGETAVVRRRHAEYFVALAEAATPYMRGPSESEWIDRLDADRENFRAAVAWADEHGETALGLRLFDALHLTWHARGRVTELRRWFDRLVAAPGVDEVPPATRAAAFGIAAWQAVTQSDHRRAIMLGEDAIRFARLAGVPILLARATLILGLAYQEHDVGTARTYLEEAVTLSRGLDDPAMLPSALGNLGVVLRRLGDFPAAAELFKQQAALEQARGSARGAARAHVDFGDLALDQGDTRAAVAHYRQALEGFHAAGDVTYLGICLTSLAVAAAYESPPAATRLLGAADVLRDRIGLTVEWLGEQLYGDAIARVRGALGEEAFAAAWAAGRALELDDAIAEALNPPEPEPDARPAPARLTRREHDVLHLLVAGKTDREIAGELFLSVRSVESYVAHILAKLGVRTRTAAVANAIATGLVKPAAPPPPD